MSEPSIPAPQAARAATANPRSWLSDNAKWVISTLAIPVSLAGSTVLYNVWAAKRSDAESRLRLYTELVNKREEADTNLRREIFAKLMEKYLDPSEGDLDQRLAVLELLTQNFNESLNLSPLFWQLDRQIVAKGGDRTLSLRGQLMRVADNAKQRQLDTLQVYGGGGEADPVFGLPAEKPILDRDLAIEMPGADGAKRRIGCHFIVEALEADASSRSVQVRVQSIPLKGRTVEGLPVEESPSCVGGFARQWMFSVDPFDFPLVNYTRMSADERFAIFFTPQEGGLYSFKFIYFPSTLGGVRDKPFIDDVMNKLRGSSR
jgi:hypothetical protein